VHRQVAQDPQPGFQGDVAERAPPGPAGTIPLAELAVAERGDGAGQPGWDGGQETAPPDGGPAAGLNAGQGRPRLVKNTVRARPAASGVPSARVAPAMSCRGLAAGSAASIWPACRKIATAPPG
jgi:hypothetical protein